MPHLSQQPFTFDFTSDALRAALEIEKGATESYRYETIFVFNTEREIIGTQVRVMDEEGFFEAYVAGEA
ncbi:hypothetical protein Ccr5_gp271 [Caulobacter phage Ccr5]|nr:hypothetical protein Ccr5_gp271 [Caulobacter phage Ccr5]